MVALLSVLVAIVVAILVARRARAVNDRSWAIAGRVLAIAAFVWNLSTTTYLLLVPTYEGVAGEGFTGGVTRVTPERQTFLEVNGLPGLAIVLIPVLLTVLPWSVSDPTARLRVRLVGSVLLLIFVIVGGLSVGLLYAPGALGMTIGAVASVTGSRQS